MIIVGVNDNGMLRILGELLTVVVDDVMASCSY